MKSSLERVNIVRIRHKEPTPLDFFTLFHMTDNNVRDRMLKENNTDPTLYLYSNETQTTTTYLVNPKQGERPLHILETMFQIMNEAEFDYYIIVTEAWRNKEHDKKYGYGEISKLPISEKQECLTTSGKSKDGKESLTILYNIIRIKPEDDSSKIIGFEEHYEGNNSSIRAEQTIKRKWFPSIHELLNSITTEAPDASEHEVPVNT